MRLLRIEDQGQGGRSIELHAQLTLICGLDGLALDRVLEGLSSIPLGSTGLLTGELESQGVRLDLTSEALAMLDLPGSVQMVVRAEDLPGADDGVGAAVDPRVDLESERDRLAADLDAARAAAEAAEAERSTLAEELERARGEDPGEAAARVAAALQAAEARSRDADAAAGAAEAALTAVEAELAGAGPHTAVTEAENLLAEARAALDPESVEALARAEAELAEAESALAALDEPDGSTPAAQEPTAPDPDPRLAALLARREELQRAMDGIGDGNPAAVSQALARVASGRVTQDHIDHARALAQEWEALVGDANEALDLTPVESDDVIAARMRLHQATKALADLEAAIAATPLASDVVESLEVVHAEVLDAQEKSEARFGGSRAKRRLAEARDAEQEVLDRLGFTTYAEFMMSSSRSVTGSDEDAVAAARRAVGDAQAELDAAIALAPTRSAREARMAALDDEIATMLGHPVDGDPTAELRGITASDDPIDDLRAALSGTGMALDDADFQPDTLVALARVWLAEQSDSATQRADLASELDEVDAALAEVGAGDGAAPVDVPPEPVIDAAARREAVEERYLDATGVVEAAQARQAAHLAAVQDVEAREAELEAALVAADEGRAAIEAALADARSALSLARSEQLEASAALAELETPADASEGLDLVQELEARLANAEVVVADATAGCAAIEHRLHDLERSLDELRATDEADAEPDAELSGERFEAIEWYLLSCMADHRQVSIAGSVPLVLADPFSGLPSDDALRLLEGVERLATAVQVVLVTEDKALVAWAEALGAGRASVVSAA